MTDDEIKTLLAHPIVGPHVRAFLEGASTALVARRELVAIARDVVEAIIAVDHVANGFVDVLAGTSGPRVIPPLVADSATSATNVRDALVTELAAVNDPA